MTADNFNTDQKYQQRLGIARSAIHAVALVVLSGSVIAFAQQAPTAAAPGTNQPTTNQPAATSPTSTTTPATQTTQGGQPPANQPQAAPQGTGQTAQPAPPAASQPPSTPPPSAQPQTSPPATPEPPAQGKNDKKSKKDNKDKGKKDAPAPQAQTIDDAIPSPGEDLNPHIRKGSEDDVNAVGTRNIGGRGLGNWYSTDSEIRMGKQYSMEVEKSAKLITDPVVTEYVNRIGQNIVKNSDCKVPFTIKVIDTDEVNAFALPGGFFYVNSGLILAADEEAELAGVMAHEIAHVCAHHAMREMTRANYANIGMIPVEIMAMGSYSGYGMYELASLAIPVTFLKFSRDFEGQADWLGMQYMYRSGYDPQALIQFFEKIESLEKHKPGFVAAAFSTHPETPDRIDRSEEEIATILPARPEYVVTTSEFDDVKARLARIENKRKLKDGKDANKPTLRRVGATDPNDPNNSGDNRPTLHPRSN